MTLAATLRSRSFAVGFAIGLVVFLAITALAAHLASDCGLPAVLGMSGCADDIRRAGFPLIFWEEGGFAFRSIFDLGALVLDVVAGLAVRAAGGWLAVRMAGRKAA